eukprot:g30841.t1
MCIWTLVMVHMSYIPGPGHCHQSVPEGAFRRSSGSERSIAPGWRSTAPSCGSARPPPRHRAATTMGGIRHEDFGYKVPAEQRSLLSRQNYTLRPLSSVGALSVLKVLDVSWQAIAVFIAALLVQSMVHSKPLLIVVLGVFLIFPVMELLVLLIGVVAATIWRGVRWKAVVFWTWWPFWKVVLCVAAACVATSFGNYLWQPSQSGWLQDAGVMTFDRASGVNRMMTGCFVDTTTFCIAAITSVTEKDGKLLPQDLSQYDLFMAGTDCCECPGEFRCGDWNVPGAHLGGYRETDAAINKFYSLASQDFAAAYHKASG